MSCEDCKNYKKKDNIPSKDAMQIAQNALATLCKNKQCKSCSLNQFGTECPIYAAHSLLSEQEVYW